MSRITNVLFVVVFICSLLPFQHNLLSATPKAEIENIKEEDLYVEIVFVGYNEDIVLENNIKFILEDIVIDPFQYTNTSFPRSRYNLGCIFSYLSDTETSELENFLLNNAINKTLAGYRANITAIDELIATRNITDFTNYFIPYGGLVIDANLVEDYIYQNLFEEKTRLEYTLYMLNFSQFDSPNHSLEHTYSIEHQEYDSNVSIPLLYPSNETIDYAPVAGWGGKHRFCFIDPSASLDYLQSLPLLYGLDTSYGAQHYYRYDLDSYCSTLNLTDYLGQVSLAIYLQEWIQSYLYNIFSPATVTTPPMTTTVSIQIHVINNVTYLGYPTESFNWITTAERIRQPLINSFPWIDWDVEVIYSEMSDNSELYSIMMSEVSQDESGYYVDLSNGLIDAFEYYQDTYFDANRAETLIPAYVILTDNTTFRVGAAPITDFIIGHENVFEFIFVKRSVYEVLEHGLINNPFIGVSSTLLRMIGHFLSYPSTHSYYYGWGTDYIDDIMSVFAREFCGSVSYSNFYGDAYARYFFDYHYYHTNLDFNTALAHYNSLGTLMGASKYVEQIPELVGEAYNLYLVMDYVNAIEKLLETQNLLDKFQDLIENPSAFQKPAIFWSVTIIGGIVVVATVFIVFNKYVKFPKSK